MGVSGNPARRAQLEARPTGIKVEVADKHGADITDPGPGEHLWVVVGSWKVVPQLGGSYQLDHENLLSIDGPGCFKCERQYSVEVAARACPGSMT